MNNSPLAYVAGPMRGIPEFNFPAFFATEEELESRGFDVINPARQGIENGFDPTGMTGNEYLSTVGFDPRKALAWDIEQVTKADLVVVLPNYELSRGARAEVAAAEALSVPVIVLDRVLAADYITLRGETIDPFELARKRIATEVMAPIVEVRQSGKDIRKRVQPVGYHATGQEAETRVTDPVTGGEKGSKLAQLGSLDPQALYTLSEVSGMGASKYAAFNFLQGYAWSLGFNALQRHLLKFWAGEELDAESGLPHLGHAAWHCLALLSLYQRQLGTDDRFRQPEVAASTATVAA